VNEAALFSLIKIVSEGYAEIQRIRANDPAADAAVSKHVLDALERAKAEALKP
jgi:hypothetical protein